MGNSSSGAIEVDDNPLRKEERESVKELYSSFLTQGGKVSAELFSKEFESLQYPSFGDACFAYVSQNSDMTFDLFQKFVIVGSRSTSTKTLQLLWDIIHSDPSLDDELTMEFFFRILLEFSGCEHNGLDVAASRLAEHAKEHGRSNGCEAVSSRALINWTNEYAPHAFKVFVTYINRKCFSKVDLQSAVPFRAPFLDGGSAIVTQSDLMPLALYDTTLQGRWKKLYTTQADGLSFNRIAHHILGYEGPSIILCEVDGGHGQVIGAYNEARWKDSNRFYGNSSSFLCRLTPTFKLLRSKSDSNGSYQWLNLKSYGMPHGLGMGGSLEKFRFFIPDTLETCIANSSCLTFEPGVVVEGTNGGEFNISIMEVWGCGGDELIELALQGQAKDRGDRDALLQQARKVDKAAFANNSFDQEFLLSKNFSHKVRMVDDSACHVTNVDSKDGDKTSGK